MNKSWSGESHVMSYNNWLREEAVDSRSMLQVNMDNLLAQLRVLESVISQEEISTVRSVRVSTALIHAMTEIHLLVTLMGDK